MGAEATTPNTSLLAAAEYISDCRAYVTLRQVLFALCSIFRQTGSVETLEMLSVNKDMDVKNSFY